MRLLFRLSIIIFFLASCETDEVRSELIQDEPETTPFNRSNHDEFIVVNLEDRQIIFTANTKSSKKDELGAEISTHYRVSGHKYYILKFWGAKENENSKEYLRFGGELRNFLGEGAYNTGKGMENNCHFFDFDRLWQSHYDKQGDSFVQVRVPSRGYIEGEFTLRLHNSNQVAKFKDVKGSFRLALD